MRSDVGEISLMVSKNRMGHLLCGAFEGGSNYWYIIDDFIHPNGPVECIAADGEVFRHIDYPLNDGGAVMVKDKFGDFPNAVRLDWQRCLEGLAIMAKVCPRQLGRFLAEDEDAETSDCFLQCAVFGKLVYG